MHAVITPDATSPLRYVELPSLPLRRGEVRVKVRAVGVNPVDWKMRGISPLGLARRLLGPPGPVILGLDFAGEVAELGADVGDLQVGDRVVGGTNFSRGQRGSYAEEVIVRPDQCAKLPDAVGFDEAACLPVPGVTAQVALVDIGGVPSTPGARVLVLGASGGVGVMAVQLAVALGAKPVGVCSTRNADFVRGLGAEVIDYTAGDVFGRARALGPYALVIDAVGTDAYPLRDSLSVLSPTGRIVLVVTSPRDYLSVVTSRRVHTVLGRPTRAALDPLVALVASGKLKPVIADRLPLAEAEEALKRSQGGKVVGKLILHP